jgi:hypothetical protein
MSRTPELLVLQGARTELTVRWAPAPAIHYRDPSWNAELEDITTREDELGATLIATLADVAGSHRVTLTLAVPPFRFPDDRDVLPVTTFAVLTLRRDSDPAGALARYTVVHLHGSVHAAPLGSAP